MGLPNALTVASLAGTGIRGPQGLPLRGTSESRALFMADSTCVAWRPTLFWGRDRRGQASKQLVERLISRSISGQRGEPLVCLRVGRPGPLSSADRRRLFG